MEPPTFFSTLMLSLSTVPSSSATIMTAFTTRSQSFSFEASAPLPVMAVSAIFFSIAASVGLMVIAMLFRIS